MPKVVDAVEKRREIVDATARLIAKEGFERTTMRRIAKEVGCTTGQVIHYFANREDILVAAVRAVTHAAAGRVTAIGERFDGRDALRAFLLESLPTDREKVHVWRVWITLWDQSLVSDTLARLWDLRAQSWASLLKIHLQKAAAAGQLRPDTDVDREVVTLTSLVYGLAVERTLRPTRLSKRAMLDAALGYFDRITLPPRDADGASAFTMSSGPETT